jgi:multidrug resistance efflux pump
MRSLIVVTLFMMLFLAFSARNQNLRSMDEPVLVHSGEDAETRIKRLEAEKAEVAYLHWQKRCECLSGVYGENHKDLKEAEFKRELARLDLEIAKIRSE